jgi:glutaredoxin-related protein
MCKFLIDDVKSMKENLDETKYLSKWQTIPQVLLYIDIVIGCIIAYTFIKEMYKK